MIEPIQRKHMQVVARVKDYKEAITQAASPLVKDDYIRETYIAQMIESLETHGPYIVLADDFALPHARPSSAVKKTGLSLLVVAEGVDVLGHNVHVFMVLAAKDSTTHVTLLGKLAEFLMEKENIQALKECSTIEALDTTLQERWPHP
jgi:mannitol/fructose-specific phosphotransferase system IIA component (Ntr-type)